MNFRRALFAAFSSALLLGLAWGCTAADNSGDVTPGGVGTGGSTELGNDASVIQVDSPRDAGDIGQNPLCGKIMCVPDSPISCVNFTPPAAASEDGGEGDDAQVSGQAGGSGEGGFGGESAVVVIPGAAGEGGTRGAGEGGAHSSADGGASGALAEGGTAGAAGALDTPSKPSKYGCQVQRIETGSSEVSSRCALAGTGAENAPCLTASDCQPGLGCVGDENAGLCQKYCCQDAEECERGTYCAARPMRDSTINTSGAPTLMIPVCAHADNCDLSVPYPCPKGSECACKGGTACTVVRSDGTTTCAVPGAGKLGDACPCAWGYVCSAASNRCLQLCYTRDSNACGTGKCQAASELPDGWGVCVGLAPSGG
jgi:hypothetical protein